MPKYMYLSRKWTCREDAFITFWGRDNKGYKWFKEMVGTYDEPNPTFGYKDDPVANVDADAAKALFVPCLYDGRIVSAVPNTPENRKALGIKKKDLLRAHISCNLARASNLEAIILKEGHKVVSTVNGQFHLVEA